MKISNEFAVNTPIDRAWALLTDLAGIAPCLPGAQLTGVTDDVYSGKVKVKVGPVVSDFAGTARFVEKNDETHRAVIDAKGRDARSAGNATALVTAQLRADGDRTLVTVETDLKISGKLAQFGSGMIKEVSGKLLGQFVTNLEAKLAAEEPSAAGPAPAAASVDLSARNGVAPGGLAAGPTAGLDLPTQPVAAAEPPEAAGSSADPETRAASTDAEPPAEPAAAGPSSDSTEPSDGAAGPSSGVAADGAAGPSSGVAAGGGAGSSGGVAAGGGAGSSGGGAVPQGARSGGAEAATSPGDWVRGDPHARVAPAVPGSAEPVAADEPEPLDLLSLAGGTFYKRIIPLGIGAVAIAAAIVWYVARR